MTIFRGPLLMMATQQQQRQRLDDAARWRRTRNAQRANADHFEREPVSAPSGFIDEFNAAMRCLSALARGRAIIDLSVEK